jgi:hypothetical protein
VSVPSDSNVHCLHEDEFFFHLEARKMHDASVWTELIRIRIKHFLSRMKNTQFLDEGLQGGLLKPWVILELLVERLDLVESIN